MGRYIQDVTGLAPDVGIDAQNQLQALPAYAGYIGFQHYWSDSLRSTVSFGYMLVDSRGYRFTTDFYHSDYAVANLIWNPKNTAFFMGIEYMYGDHETADHSYGRANRIQLSVQYDLRRMMSYGPARQATYLATSGRVFSKRRNGGGAKRRHPPASGRRGLRRRRLCVKIPYAITSTSTSTCTCRQVPAPKSQVRKRKKPAMSAGYRNVVPKAGLEPARPCERHPLKMVCLPIPPLRHVERSIRIIQLYGNDPPLPRGSATSWAVPSAPPASRPASGAGRRGSSGPSSWPRPPACSSA